MPVSLAHNGMGAPTLRGIECAKWKCQATTQPKELIAHNVWLRSLPDPAPVLTSISEAKIGRWAAMRAVRELLPQTIQLFPSMIQMPRAKQFCPPVNTITGGTTAI